MLGIIVDAAEIRALAITHILANAGRVLVELFKWEHGQADAFLGVITVAAEHSGGGLLLDVPRTVHDCPEHEDNLILDLAAEVGAMLIVSNDSDLLSMSPWRGTPVLTPAAAYALATRFTLAAGSVVRWAGVNRRQASIAMTATAAAATQKGAVSPNPRASRPPVRLPSAKPPIENA